MRSDATSARASSSRRRLRQLVGALRTPTPDVSTAEGRSQERHRRIALTALATASARGLGMLSTLVTVPLAMGHLGAERFGLWMTVASVVAMLGFADLGLGNGLVNAVSTADGRGDAAAVRRHVASAFFMLTLVAALVLAAFGAAYPWVSWPEAFNVASTEAASEAGPTAAVLVLCFALSMPLGVAHHVRTGFQQGFASAAWAGAGTLLGLVGLLAAVGTGASLPWLVAAAAGLPALSSLASAAELFGLRRPDLRPRWRDFSLPAGRALLRTGLLFCVLQLAVAAAYTSDNLIAAHLLGPSAVAEYAVASRPFGLVPLLLATALSPLWPAYGEAIARGDVPWVRRTLGRSVFATAALGALISALLFAFNGPLMRAWVGDAVAPSPLLLAGLAVWTVLASAGHAIAMFLNGAGAISLQAGLAVAMASAALGAKIVLAREIGLAGLAWGTVAAYATITLAPLCVYVPRVLARLDGASAVRRGAGGAP